MVKISHTTVSGRTYLNLDAFAPAGQWDEFLVIDSRKPVQKGEEEPDEPEGEAAS